ncbi:hypothetical protein ABH930_007305 [Kitasatospora sp. GAS204A]|uniref:hypothetical protein n=1 Tax=unclassified Kitasatospora TaxID=2633591 RepID=UPI0024743E94|nr:hypothetical protein [Kitasatospora sp. GAS204B]MDH6122175.1 hypothetical protein [Kitasatospora sp. GAS204B]
MCVVITGGAGFIGADQVGLAVPLFKGSILDPALLEAGIGGADELASRSPADPLPRHRGEVLGRPLEVTYIEPRAGDVRDSVAGIGRRRELFPDLAPAPVPVRVGPARTARWFRDRQP